MTEPGKSRFVYVIYIRTTPERLWAALTSPGICAAILARRLSRGRLEGWRIVEARFSRRPDVRCRRDPAFEPPRRLGIRWRNEFRPELKAEGWSLCTMEIEPVDDAVKLTVTHSMEREGSKFIDAVSDGWPQILSNLKSLLETGSVVLGPKYLPK